MTELGNPPNHPTGALGRALLSVAYALAIAGGTVMLALVAMMVASILGRGFLGYPIYGDFELVGIGTAVSVSLALPYCHLQRGNVIVDLFLAGAPDKVKAGCDAAAGLLLALLAAVLAWRSALGMLDLIEFHEVSVILALPLWWAFPFVILSLSLLSLCALYGAWRDAKGATS